MEGKKYFCHLLTNYGHKLRFSQKKSRKADLSLTKTARLHRASSVWKPQTGVKLLGAAEWLLRLGSIPDVLLGKLAFVPACITMVTLHSLCTINVCVCTGCPVANSLVWKAVLLQPRYVAQCCLYVIVDLYSRHWVTSSLLWCVLFFCSSLVFHLFPLFVPLCHIPRLGLWLRGCECVWGWAGGGTWAPS